MADNTCSIDGCENARDARGWCNKHYLRWRKHGDPEGKRQIAEGCSVADCDGKHLARGYCAKHYNRWKTHGDPLIVKQGGNPAGDPVPRFWSKVDIRSSDECWLWTGTFVSRGYGGFKAGGKMYRAHRYAYELVNGPIEGDLFVCHSCDTPACVNPAHLWLGTNEENSADRHAKGRTISGEEHYAAKLMAADVRAIRADERPSSQIAALYGISHGEVRRIKRREKWRDVQ